MIATVWLQGWELEKWQGTEDGGLGEPPLELGDQVEWELFPLNADLRERLRELLGPEMGVSITHLEAQQHRPTYDPPAATRGQIASVQVAYWKWRPTADKYVDEPAPGTAVFQERQILNAFDEWDVPGPDGGYRHGGFIVELA